MRLYVRLLAIVLLLAVVLAGLSLSVTPTQAQESSCKELLNVLDSIPPDSPAYQMIMDMAQERCGEALDLAALVDLYHSTGGEDWWGQSNWLREDVHHCDGWAGVSCTADRRVNLICLSFNNLNGDIPESFGNLARLQTLHLWENQLGSLPESFGNLSSLQELYLWDNQLSSLPDSFGNLSSLQELYLWDNHLSSLPESFDNLSSLYALQLDYNPGVCFTTAQKDFISSRALTDIDPDDYETCGE